MAQARTRKPRPKKSEHPYPLADKIEHLPLDRLKPYPLNAKSHSDDQIRLIARSIAEYGWTTPILVDDRDSVIAGHARLLAAQQLGLDVVPVIRLAHLTPAQIRAYRIADNRLTELGAWDTSTLVAELDSLKMENFDIDLTGFSLQDLGRLRPADERADDVPPVPKEPITKPGDLWLLGDHRLVCGDSTDPAVAALVLDGAKPNLMVTDPPYGIEYDPNWRVSLGNAYTSLGKVRNDDRADWSAAYRLFDGSVAYVWHDFTCAQVFRENLEVEGFSIRQQIVWGKNAWSQSQAQYHRKHELCWYASRGNDFWIGGKIEESVWMIARPSGIGSRGDEVKTPHSTQKPVECMERPIRNHKGDVYDPFLGSGTTLIGAHRQERRCYAIEISPAYCDVAVERWETYTGKTAQRIMS